MRLVRRLERTSDGALLRGAAAMGAVAVLSGSNMRYLVRKREVSLGRETEEKSVDVNLSLEGNAGKVSRLHAFIKLRSDGNFYIRNVGKRVLRVNNKEVEPGQKRKLPNKCLIEIGGLWLLYQSNTRLAKSMATRLCRAPP
mmetsp:Transcript_9685/g.35469  ORF Transcript_9685/g.35469 Transcript_9685/m.35469 type:complete len:141 (-) Transcript_9685:236-658(-)